MKQLDDDRLKHLAQVTADALALQYNRRYGSRIPVPLPLEFELELTRPKAAGMAWSYPDMTPKGGLTIRTQKIELNMTIFRDNPREFLNTIIQHEVAHLKQRWDDVKNQAQSAEHGYVWQIAMRAMNQVPKNTHSMDATKAIAVYKEHKAKARKAKKAQAAKDII